MLKDSERLVDGVDVPHPRKQPVPLPAIAILVLLLATAPIGLALSRKSPQQRSGNTLADIARKAGCQLQEYQNARLTNPPVTGRLVEHARVTDGSHIGGRTPSVDATTHSLLHGRVLIQYKPGLPAEEVRALDQFVKSEPHQVVGFANQTGMSAPVAATAYLSLLTCPRVNARTLRALQVFRDRRRGFGNAF